jgi:membrane protein
MTSTRLIADMETGINRVWNIENKRHLAKRMFFYWFLILAFPICLAGYVAFNSTKEYSDLSAQIGHEVFNAMMLSGILFFVYKFVPDLKVRAFSALTGAIVGSMLTITVHKGFLWASHTVFNYSKLYGGIAALPLFLLWVLLLWYGILFGAIVSASFKHPRNPRNR